MSEPHDWTDIVVPRDVEADVVLGLSRFGIRAATIVPANRQPGTVRISRTGGELEAHSQRDNPTILVEVWEESPTAAFDLAIRVYAAFQVFSSTGIIHDNVAVNHIDLQTPRAFDDPQAPDLSRVQFITDFLIELDTITLTEENNNGE